MKSSYSFLSLETKTLCPQKWACCAVFVASPVPIVFGTGTGVFYQREQTDSHSVRPRFCSTDKWSQFRQCAFLLVVHVFNLGVVSPLLRCLSSSSEPAPNMVSSYIRWKSVVKEAILTKKAYIFVSYNIQQRRKHNPLLCFISTLLRFN